MGLNRMLMRSYGENSLIMTMGYKSLSKTTSLYGYSVSDAIGSIKGTLLCKGKKATITYIAIAKHSILISGVKNIFSFALRFTTDMIDTSLTKATVAFTNIATGESASLTISNISYDYDAACYVHDAVNIDDTPFVNFAVDSNIGKQFKVEIIFD